MKHVHLCVHWGSFVCEEALSWSTVDMQQGQPGLMGTTHPIHTKNSTPSSVWHSELTQEKYWTFTETGSILRKVFTGRGTTDAAWSGGTVICSSTLLWPVTSDPHFFPEIHSRWRVSAAFWSMCQFTVGHRTVDMCVWFLCLWIVEVVTNIDSSIRRTLRQMLMHSVLLFPAAHGTYGLFEHKASVWRPEKFLTGQVQFLICLYLLIFWTDT